MKKITTYLLIIVIAIFVAALYCFKMAEMGMSLKTTVTFVIMFFAVLIAAGLIIMLFTGRIRKKLDNELKSGED